MKMLVGSMAQDLAEIAKVEASGLGAPVFDDTHGEPSMPA